MDHEKPWLVSLQLMVAEGTAKHYSADAGVDHAVMAVADTASQADALSSRPSSSSFACWPARRRAGDATNSNPISKTIGRDDDDLAPMVDAWSKGEADKLAALMNGELADQPDAKKALLTDRNQRWALQIETMLREKRVFFITVGAGHLAGPDGVPALLRKAGYKVEGP